MLCTPKASSYNHGDTRSWAALCVTMSGLLAMSIIPAMMLVADARVVDAITVHVMSVSR